MRFQSAGACVVALALLGLTQGCSADGSASNADAKVVIDIEDVESLSGSPMAVVDEAEEGSVAVPVAGSIVDDRVLAAAVVVVAGGDIEQALLEDLFSLDELDAAIDAIESGTLERYLD